LNALLALPEAAATDADSAQARLRGLTMAGFTHWHQGSFGAARALLGEALALGRTLDDQPSVALVLRYLGLVSDREGDAAGARERFEQSLAIYRTLENGYEVSWSLAMLGDLALRADDDARARSLYDEGAALLRAMGNKTFLAYVRRRMGQLDLRAGDLAAAAPAYRESLELNLALDDRRSVAACLIGLANVAAASGRTTQAVQLLGAATATLRALNATLLPADQAELERSVNALRASTESGAFDAAWAEGEGLALQEAAEMGVAT
jgi:tetratricopeptide (TPR) repeat protein